MVYSELFWSVFYRSRTEYGEISISPYSVRMRENTDQNNSEYWRFLRMLQTLELLACSKKMSYDIIISD